MTDFLDRLADQFVIAERSLTHATPIARSRYRRWRTRRTLVVVLAGIVAAGGVAVAATNGGGPVAISQYIAGQRDPIETTVSSAQAAAFSILRRPVTAGDALPRAEDPVMWSGIYGMNAALARHVQLRPNGADAWVVPGRGAICLVADGGATCEANALAVKVGVILESGSRGVPGHDLAGLVPDGARAVTITNHDGHRQLAEVDDNVWEATVRGTLKTISFDTADGPVTRHLGR